MYTIVSLASICVVKHVPSQFRSYVSLYQEVSGLPSFVVSVSCLLKSAFNGEYNVKTQFGKREHGLVYSLLLFASNRLGLLRLRRSSNFSFCTSARASGKRSSGQRTRCQAHIRSNSSKSNPRSRLSFSKGSVEAPPNTATYGSTLALGSRKSSLDTTSMAKMFVCG